MFGALSRAETSSAGSRIVSSSRALLVLLTATIIALVPLLMTVAPARAESIVVVDDISFVNDSFADGSRQALSVQWTVDGEATNPVSLTIPLPEDIRGFSDRFDMIGPDGQKAGTCEVSTNAITCTVDESFVNENPVNVSGEFTFDVHTTYENKESEVHTIEIGGFENEVTVGPNPNWCETNCEISGASAGKWGSYNNLTDEIIWVVQIPAGEQGIEAGKAISVMDEFDPEQYEIIDDGTYPRVLEGRSISYSKWGNEGVDYRVKPAEQVEWSADNHEVIFESVAGEGQDAELGEGTRGTDGSFYLVEWRVKALTGGELNAQGNRVFHNKASYSIDSVESTEVTGSAVRYSGNASVVGANYGRLQVTKELTGNTTLNPTFEITYKASDADGAPIDALSGEATITSGNTWTSPDFFRGTTVEITEIKPIDPGNVDWADPVFVDDDGNPVTELTFNSANGNLGKVTKLRLVNKAELKTGTFSASKSLIDDDGIDEHEGKDLRGSTYRLDYSYPANSELGIPAGSGSLELPGSNEVVTSDEIPVGAELTFSEMPAAEPGATWAEPVISPASLIIGDGESVDVTVTNTITQDVGGFSLIKAVSGSGESLVPEGTEFLVDYSYDTINGFDGGKGQITVVAGGEPAVVEGLPIGAEVTLSEVKPVDPLGGEWGEPKFSLAEFPIVKDTQIEISLDNPITWGQSNFSVQKFVTGDGADAVPDDTEFTVEYDYTLPEDLPLSEGQSTAGSGTLTLTYGADAEPALSEALPYGTTVTLREAAPVAIPGHTWGEPIFSQDSLTIGEAGSVIGVKLENPITRDLGAISVTKEITGSGAGLVGDDASFTVHYSYPAGEGFEAGEGTVEVPADGSGAEISDLPASAVVSLTEDEAAPITGATWGAPVFSVGDELGSIVNVVNGETVAVTLENPVELNPGTFDISKAIFGSGTDLVDPDASFVVEYDYPAGEGFEAGSGILDVPADGSVVTSPDLPFGARVTLTEHVPGDVEGATWTGAEFSVDDLVIGEGPSAEVLLTNTIEKDPAPTPDPTPTPGPAPDPSTEPAPAPEPSTGGPSVNTGGTALSGTAWITGAALLLLGAGMAGWAIRRSVRRH